MSNSVITYNSSNWSDLTITAQAIGDSSYAAGKVAYTSEGLGVTGFTSQDGPNAQLGYNPATKTSESLKMVLPVDSLEAKINITHLISKESDSKYGEMGKVFAYDSKGNLVGSMVFSPKDLDSGGNFVFKTTSAFNTLVFKALPYDNNSKNNYKTKDSSDYFVKSVTVTECSVNHNPVANPDKNSITVGQAALNGNVLPNDTDADGDSLKVTTTGTFHGSYGDLILNGDGSYTYTPNAAAGNLPHGQVVNDVFNYTNHDTHGGSSSSTLTICVTGSNQDDDCCDEGKCFDAGTSNATFVGTDCADVIHAGSGNSTIKALGGNDVVYADSGNHTLNAGKGNDIVFDGVGQNTMIGESGNDTFIFDSRKFDFHTIPTTECADGLPHVVPYGTPGSVYLSGGTDTVQGGDGQDIINLRGDGWIINPTTGLANVNDDQTSYTGTDMSGQITNSITGAVINFTSITTINITDQALPNEGSFHATLLEGCHSEGNCDVILGHKDGHNFVFDTNDIIKGGENCNGVVNYLQGGDNINCVELHGGCWTVDIDPNKSGHFSKDSQGNFTCNDTKEDLCGIIKNTKTGSEIHFNTIDKIIVG